MASRMRERDDEDLALEQIQRDTPLTETTSPRHVRVADEARRARLAQLRAELTAVNAELAALLLRELKSLESLESSITSLNAHRDRLGKQRGWRERRARSFDLGRLELQLKERREERDLLAEQVGDRDAVKARAAGLHEQRHKLSEEHRELCAGLIAEEIERGPSWLQSILGPQPEQPRLRDRWQRTAREVAAYRLDHEITDPDHALGDRRVPGTSARAVQRAITDTRSALGLDGPSVGHGHGQGLE